VVVCGVGSEEIRQLKKELNEAQKQVQLRELPSSVTTRRVSNSRQLDESDDNDDVSSPFVIICHFKKIFRCIIVLFQHFPRIVFCLLFTRSSQIMCSSCADGCGEHYKSNMSLCAYVNWPKCLHPELFLQVIN